MKKRFTLMMMVLCFLMSIPLKMMAEKVTVHYINEKGWTDVYAYVYKNGGGHIGDGIRPSERRKGYATKMISLALEECKKLGMDKVLLVCDKDNIGSVKSIINNGGVLENVVLKEGKLIQRYWIML